MQKSKKRRPRGCFPWNFQTFAEELSPEEHNLEKLLVDEIHFFREELKPNSQMKVFHKKTFLKQFVKFAGKNLYQCPVLVKLQVKFQ